MAGEVFDRVLPFAIGIICGRPHDTRSALLSALTVAVNVFHTDHHVCPIPLVFVWRFLEDHSPFANIELGSVAAHINTHGKAEYIAKPFPSREDILID